MSDHVGAGVSRDAGRIIAALYGPDHVFKAPELFEPGHRALIFIAAGDVDMLHSLADYVEERRRKIHARAEEPWS